MVLNYFLPPLNIHALTNALFVLEARVDTTVLDVGNLTTEVRLHPRQRSESSGPISRLTWTAYGVMQTGGPRSRSPSRSATSESSNRPEGNGFLEELELRAETITDELDARIAVLEERERPPATMVGMTMAETTQRFEAITGDLRMLNDALFSEHQQRDQAYAAPLKKVRGCPHSKWHVAKSTQKYFFSSLSLDLN
ncbi:hypothetical protein B0H11DRAFT_1935759 [Mycena galericulata]|nr:hypothetical protein B0H11DRAFT_1935759 [Mycena galericulata]